jgi:hypothetical protein
MEPEPYQERYDWDRRMWTLLCCGAVAVLLAIGVAMPLLPTILLLGCGLLILLWALLHRRVALRVDAAGVTLGGSPLHYRASTVRVPWPDIVAILVWQHILPSGALVPQLGVQRRQDETPQLTTRPVSGFQLDRRALARAAAVYAPHVLVLDSDTGREITGTDTAT